MCISNNNMDHLSMHKQNVIKIHSLFLKILRKNEIKTPIKGHISVEKFGKISCVSHCIHKISLNLSSCSQFIKWKQNSDINQGP